MRVRREVLGDAHVDRATARRDRLHARVPGADHALRVGRDLDAAGPGPAHALVHHAHRAGRERAARRARDARARGAPQRPDARTRSRRSSCSARSTAACRRPTPRSPSRSACWRRSKTTTKGGDMSTVGAGAAAAADRRRVDGGDAAAATFERADPYTGERGHARGGRRAARTRAAPSTRRTRAFARLGGHRRRPSGARC